MSPITDEAVGAATAFYGNLRGLSEMDRFEAQYIPEPNSGCWLWVGSVRRDNRPYGRLVVRGKQMAAHRFSYEVHKGQIPDGLWVLHKCDNPACVNPDHLFLGTNQDNVDDRSRKGRTCRGTAMPNAKLTQDQVRSIRASSLSVLKLSKIYNMSTRSIYLAKVGRSYVEEDRA